MSRRRAVTADPTPPLKPIAPAIAVHCAHDALVAVTELRPHPRNPNRHPERQVRLLASIIERAGWRSPIAVSTRSGFITKGHGRLEAALRLGVDTVPVDYQDYASDADELADIVADNKLASMATMPKDELAPILAELTAVPDFDITLTGFTARDVTDLLTVPTEVYDFLATDTADGASSKVDAKQNVALNTPQSRPSLAAADEAAHTRLSPRLPLPILLDADERAVWAAAKDALGIQHDGRALLTLARNVLEGQS